MAPGRMRRPVNDSSTDLGDTMPRVSLDLELADDRAIANSDGWRIAPGLVPGESNQGLVAEMGDSPARLSDLSLIHI